MDAGEIDVYYTIAADYMETGDVTLHMPRFALVQTDDNLIRSLIVQHLAQDIDQKLYLRLLYPASFREINLQRQAQPADTEQTTNEVVSNFDQDFLVVYIFALVLMLGVFMTSGYLMQTVIEEKETRLIEILIAGMRPTYLLAGKILALGVLGMLQIGVWLVAMTLLARLAAASAVEALSSVASLSLPPDRLILMIVYFIFGYLFFAAAFGIIGAISTSMQEGPQYAVIFTLPSAIPLWFIVLFTTQPDGGLPTALSIIPLTSPISMMMRVAITNVPAFQIIISLLLLVITDIFLIWLAGRVFRVNTLLAGQVPKLRDLPRLLRG
jgi:ABC-2 type transport system permease protein